jgi:hypothetical protein
LITIVNKTPQFGASLTDNSRVVISDDMFLKQATGPIYIDYIVYLLQKISLPNEEVICTEPSPSVSVSCSRF